MHQYFIRSAIAQTETSRANPLASYDHPWVIEKEYTSVDHLRTLRDETVAAIRPKIDELVDKQTSEAYKNLGCIIKFRMKFTAEELVTNWLAHGLLELNTLESKAVFRPGRSYSDKEKKLIVNLNKSLSAGVFAGRKGCFSFQLHLDKVIVSINEGDKFDNFEASWQAALYKNTPSYEITEEDFSGTSGRALWILAGYYNHAYKSPEGSLVFCMKLDEFKKTVA